MDYSDNIYFSRFSVDPESEFIDPVLSEDIQLLETSLFDQLGDELLTDLDDCHC